MVNWIFIRFWTIKRKFYNAGVTWIKTMSSRPLPAMISGCLLYTSVQGRVFCTLWSAFIPLLSSPICSIQHDSNSSFWKQGNVLLHNYSGDFCSEDERSSTGFWRSCCAQCTLYKAGYQGRAAILYTEQNIPDTKNGLACSQYVPCKSLFDTLQL